MKSVLVTGGSGFIGTNLIDHLLENGCSVLNLDVNPPKITAHEAYWKECDILDFDRIHRLFEEYQPSHVIHLAARTDTNSNNLDDYKTNIQGTNNILGCIQTTSSIQRVIITSSQFVMAPPGLPKNDTDYNPIGAYGKSKVLTEIATRNAGLNCIWTIIRPTNIWGPWHPRYPREFWLVLKRGFYFHPGGKSSIRSYGYVENIIHQMMRIFDAAPALVDRKVYYVGDPPIQLIDWTNSFSLAITGKPVRIIPRYLLATLATTGSVLTALGIRFPITRSRYRSMTEDYYSPVATTITTFGSPPYSLEAGVHETMKWLNKYWDGKFS
jgi:nucleoside-diphosphate-sugar epimerase